MAETIFSGVVVTILASILLGLGNSIRKRRRRRDEPLDIKAFRAGGPGVYCFRPDTAGWRIVEIRVVDVSSEITDKKVLEKVAFNRTGDLSDVLSYPEGAHEVDAVGVHTDCLQATLAFTCEKKGTRILWWQRKKKVRVLFQYDKYRKYPVDPRLQELRGYLL